MKYTLVIILILLGPVTYGQITFSSIPIDKQLVGRDPNTNFGNIHIKGEVDNSMVSYDSILIEVYRNDNSYSTSSQYLDYSDNIASFDFNISIVAELANYSFKLYGKEGSGITLEKEVDSLVAGDVFVIQGQSNAEAKMLEGSANGNRNEFIRVYAKGTHFPDTLLALDNWFIGEGDGNRNTVGNAGQWGLKMARMLVDSLQIPVAIFNCGHGGKEISFFQAPTDYQTSLNSNYGRLYYRLNKTGLKPYVRAILWSQGEWDGDHYGNTSTIEYKNNFLSLKSSWLTDYPNIEKFYIFQTKNGCGGNLHQVKEAQRQLAIENEDISIMSTAALIHYIDDCHFNFTDGYELFAKRIFPLLQRDLYGITTSNDIDPPMIIYANLIDNNTLVVGTDAVELSIITTAEDFELTNTVSSAINNITASSNEIIFTLSKNPGAGATISYLAQETGIGNFITNQTGLELICFNDYPITDKTEIGNNTINNLIKVYPNPTSDFLTIELANSLNIVKVTLIDFLGIEVFNSRFNKNKVEINVDGPAGIYLLMVENEDGLRFVEKIMMQ